MDVFRTELIPTPSDVKITLNTPLLTIGSCFSEFIGNKLNENKFQVLANPFGTVYNPISIHGLLDMTIKKRYPDSHSYLQHKETHFNYHFHSKFFSASQDPLARQIEESINVSHGFIRKTKVLILTYGTSFVFERSDTKEIVSNCHKMPSSKFNKRLLSVEEIVSSYQELHEQIKKNLAVEKIVLTVSPVRHIKDSLELNNVSKSVLRIACQKLVTLFSDVEYFPSFEIMMDDLRDYRFYKADMIHPTDSAEDYIWEKFSNAYFDVPALLFLKSWGEIRKALSHKAFYPEGHSHQAFLHQTLSKLEEIGSLVSVEEEIKQIRSRISPLS